MATPTSQSSSYSYSSQPGNQQYYQAAYNNALRMNKRNYGNILRGYSQAQRRATQTQNRITRGYQELGDSVMGRLEGVGEAQQQEINDRYAAARGQQAQQMTNAGLGNTTVSSAVSRGLTLDQQKAGIDLAGKIAQMQAGFQTQIGMGGLQSQSQGMNVSADLASRYMGALASYQTPYPALPSMGSTSMSRSNSVGYGGGGGQVSGGGGGYPMPSYGGNSGGGGYGGGYGPTQGQPSYMDWGNVSSGGGGGGGGYGGGGGGGYFGGEIGGGSYFSAQGMDGL